MVVDPCQTIRTASLLRSEASYEHQPPPLPLPHHLYSIRQQYREWRNEDTAVEENRIRCRMVQGTLVCVVLVQSEYWEVVGG